MDGEPHTIIREVCSAPRSRFDSTAYFQNIPPKLELRYGDIQAQDRRGEALCEQSTGQTKSHRENQIGDELPRQAWC